MFTVVLVSNGDFIISLVHAPFPNSSLKMRKYTRQSSRQKYFTLSNSANTCHYFSRRIVAFFLSYSLLTLVFNNLNEHVSKSTLLTNFHSIFQFSRVSNLWPCLIEVERLSKNLTSALHNPLHNGDIYYVRCTEPGVSKEKLPDECFNTKALKPQSSTESKEATEPVLA